MLRRLYSEFGRPRHIAARLLTRRCCVQHHAFSTSILRFENQLGGPAFPSAGKKDIHSKVVHHVSSNELREEIEADANKTATGHALPSFLERDIDALRSGKHVVEEAIRLGNRQKLHRVEASETVEFGVPVGSSGLTYPAKMDAVFARDSCTCPMCVDPSSKQKQFQTSDIPANIKATSTLDPEKQTLEVTWTNDIPGFPKDHVTRFDLKPASVSCKDSVYHPLEPKNRLVWDGKTIAEKNKWISYDRYMKDELVLHEALEQLGRYGLVFLTGVPDSEKSVEHIVSRIGILKDTFYGRTWDVKSIPNAKNIAYTHQYLGLHMDLMYVTNPPHLQLLHSLRARSPGGESIFSDSLHAAFTLERTDRAAFDVLTSTPVPFYYKNDNQSYAKWRPTIELAEPLAGLSPNPTNTVVSASADDPVLGTSLAGREILEGVQPPPRIKCINYSPPFQAPFAPTALADLGLSGLVPFGPLSATQKFAPLHDALQKFAKLVESPEALFEHRLEEGQCVIFDNRRVLHARRAFDASKGERWLKGAYVDDDVFFSRWRVLAEKAAGRASEGEKVWERLYGKV
ncbi:Taurine catabolism dioxygenase TauD/TfdA [Lasiodiplodia theobromae]|uniref:Taurine catabolism dioxygenase TauD/TfdA n=1 Tax=Lasiodiplodia theobromae TaxID=45133 RepID=UPI0015C374EA|nr:Taurine catabolism dioxygenase TauD/TfdA [Lasiodiplodia theobromae]KAF4535987.1 Taurine catabolism dioxygenase TauD/TfdA [Lasiodiplodia theobromae]